MNLNNVILIQKRVGRFIFHKPSLLRHVHTQTVFGALGQPQSNSKRSFRQRTDWQMARCWSEGRLVAHPSFFSTLLSWYARGLDQHFVRSQLVPISFICAATAPHRLCSSKPPFLHPSPSLYLSPSIHPSLKLSAPLPIGSVPSCLTSWGRLPKD